MVWFYVRWGLRKEWFYDVSILKTITLLSSPLRKEFELQNKMFAAYASNDPSQSSSSSADVETDSSRNWLENSSFISTAIPSKAVGKVTSDSKRNKKKKRQKKKEQEKEKTKNLDNYSYLSFSNSTPKNDIAFKNTIHNHGFQSINEMFYEDHKPIRSNLAFPHMHFKDVALYCIKFLF